MSGLIYNEIAKVVAQRRFAVVIVILTLLSILSALSMRGMGGTLGINAAAMVSKGASGSFAQLLYPFFLAAIIGDIVAGELSAGTIKLLLIRPVSRWKIWLSKLTAAYVVGAVVILYSALCIYVALGAATGFGHWSAPFSYTNSTSTLLVTLRSYGLEMLSLLSVVSVFMFISTVVESGVAAVGLCTGLAFICSIVQSVVAAILPFSSKPRWIEYFFFEHWQVAGYATQSYSLEHWTVGGSLLDLAIWTVILLSMGIYIFQMKDVKG